jgi:dTDP-glucose pyrophosphorylase
MTDLALVMPMAGRGSRFRQDGRETPKPLIELHGHPFFWWATESVRRAAPLREIVFVVLAEHVEAFGIDRRIRELYPDATIVTTPVVTGGAAETAALGVRALRDAGPMAVNDCDHAFDAAGLDTLARRLGGDTHEGIEGALLGFRADTPAYSYVKLGGNGMVVATVEKKVVSPFAIAGCYLFADSERFLTILEGYRNEQRYAELFVSGMYDVMIRDGARIAFQSLVAHVPFGTPEEMQEVTRDELAALGLE